MTDLYNDSGDVMQDLVDVSFAAQKLLDSKDSEEWGEEEWDLYRALVEAGMWKYKE